MLCPLPLPLPLSLCRWASSFPGKRSQLGAGCGWPRHSAWRQLLTVRRCTHPSAIPAGYWASEEVRSHSQPSFDIGLIALASPCSVAPARLPEGQAQGALGTRQLAQPLPTAGTRVFAAGFGITEDGEVSDVLR